MKIAAIILGCLAVLWLLWALIGWNKVAKFVTAVTTAQIMAMLSRGGLQTCDQSFPTINSQTTPGLVSAETLTLSSHCAFDANPLKVTLLQFSDEASRNAAQQRIATTHRNGFGPHFAYSYGPYVITLQGSRGIADQVVLGQILSQAGANP